MGTPAETSFEQEEQLRRQGNVLQTHQYTVDERGCLSLRFSLEAWSLAQISAIHTDALRKKET